MTEQMINLKNLQDEMNLVISKKMKEGEWCWACGSASNDPQNVGDERFMLSSQYTDEDGVPDWEYLEFCPKHFAFLLNLALTHLIRAEKGREESPLKLPMVQDPRAA